MLPNSQTTQTVETTLAIDSLNLVVVAGIGCGLPSAQHRSLGKQAPATLLRHRQDAYRFGHSSPAGSPGRRPRAERARRRPLQETSTSLSTGLWPAAGMPPAVWARLVVTRAMCS
jgi:hypothetical protein